MAETIKKETKPTSAWQGAFKAYKTAFDLIKNSPGPALFFVIFYGVASILSALVQSDQLYYYSNYVSFEDISYLVFLLALPVYALSLADGKKLSIGEVMRFNAHKYFSLLFAVILSIVLIALSAVAFIIPIIWTIAWFYFVTYAVADKDLGSIGALKESKRLAKNNKGKVWGVIGVSILVSIAGSLLGFIPYIGGIVAAAATVWVTVVGALLYRWLEHSVKNEVVVE